MEVQIAFGLGVVLMVILIYLDFDWNKIISFESVKSSSIDIRKELYYHGVMSIFHNYGLGLWN